MTDYDPRLVELYDTDNPAGPDHEFYRALADESSACRIIDLGCGTGILTATFARPGRSVVGVDPSAAMLEYASRRPGADAVDWVRGDSRDIPGNGFDYAVMSGNVAQHIADPDWDRTLRDLRRALRRGALLAFEARNPDAEAWKRWASEAPITRETAHGALREWMDVDELAAGLVRITAHNVFQRTGEHVTEELTLTFRSSRAVIDQLGAGGFDVQAVYGDWDRSAFTRSSAIMVFVARAK